MKKLLLCLLPVIAVLFSGCSKEHEEQLINTALLGGCWELEQEYAMGAEIYSFTMQNNQWGMLKVYSLPVGGNPVFLRSYTWHINDDKFMDWTLMDGGNGDDSEGDIFDNSDYFVIIKITHDTMSLRRNTNGDSKTILNFKRRTDLAL